jgi:hypothetical protein
MNIITIESPLSFSTAGGDASFMGPTGAIYNNDVGRKRLTLEAGSIVTIVGGFPKTHTWFAIVQSATDGDWIEQGAVLRLDAMEKLQAHSEGA